jgi:hypothetical protein
MTIPVDLGIIQFKSKDEAMQYFSKMLNNYERLEKVTKDDDVYLRELIKHHPEAETKIADGISYFFIDLEEGGTHCFYIMHPDGTDIDFSYKKCVYNYRPQPVEA